MNNIIPYSSPIVSFPDFRFRFISTKVTQNRNERVRAGIILNKLNIFFNIWKFSMHGYEPTTVPLTLGRGAYQFYHHLKFDHTLMISQLAAFSQSRFLIPTTMEHYSVGHQCNSRAWFHLRKMQCPQGSVRFYPETSRIVRHHSTELKVGQCERSWDRILL